MPNSFLSSLSTTPQQKAMANARNPQNNNSLNEVDISATPEKNKVLGQNEYTKQTQQQTGTGAAAGVQRKADQGLNSSPVASMLGSLGSFGLSLQAATNQFLNGQGAADINVALTQGGTIDYKDGMWKPSDLETTVSSDVNPLLNSKVIEQQNIKAMMQDGGVFNDKGQANKFEEVLAKFADKNNNGVIDPDEQLWLNNAFSVANAVRRVKEMEPGSAQYEALMAQLTAMDKDGLVSGVIQAVDEYDKITGKDGAGFEVMGADTEAYSLRDITQMGVDDLRSQLTDAVTGSLGIFGEDFSVGLKRVVDESAIKYRKSSEEEALVNQEIKDTAYDWIDRYKTEFEGLRGELNAIYTEGAQGLAADIDADIATAGKDTATGQALTQAKQWVTDLATDNIKGTDFADVVYNFMTSEQGVHPETSAIIKKYLGTKLDSSSAGGGANLGTVLAKIAETGRANALSADGMSVISVPISTYNRLKIAHVLVDPRLDEAGKASTIEGIIETSAVGAADMRKDKGTLKELFTEVADGKGNMIPKLTAAVGAFTTSLDGTLKTFENSLAQSSYNAGKASGLTSREALIGNMTTQANEISSSITKQENIAIERMNTSIAAAQADIARIETASKASAELTPEAIKTITGKFDSAFTTVGTNVANTINTWAAPLGLTPEQTGQLTKLYTVTTLVEANKNIPGMSAVRDMIVASGGESVLSGASLKAADVGKLMTTAAIADKALEAMRAAVISSSNATQQAQAAKAALPVAKAEAERAIAAITAAMATVRTQSEEARTKLGKAILDPMTALGFAKSYADSQLPTHSAMAQTVAGPERRTGVSLDLGAAPAYTGALGEGQAGIMGYQTYQPAATPTMVAADFNAPEVKLTSPTPIAPVVTPTDKPAATPAATPTAGSTTNERQEKPEKPDRVITRPDKSSVVVKTGPGGGEFYKEVYDENGNLLYKHEGYGGVPASNDDLRTPWQKLVQWIKEVAGGSHVAETEHSGLGDFQKEQQLKSKMAQGGSLTTEEINFLNEQYRKLQEQEAYAAEQQATADAEEAADAAEEAKIVKELHDQVVADYDQGVIDNPPPENTDDENRPKPTEKPEPTEKPMTREEKKQLDIESNR